MGIEGIRPYGNGRQLKALCPFHPDRSPSMSVSAEDGRWTCHAGCGERNLTTLARRLGRTDLPGRTREPYVRLTSRPSGSIDSICSELRYAAFLLSVGYRREDVERGLRDEFDLSPSTAHERVAWLTGQRRVEQDEHGVLRGRRMAYCLRKVREQSKEHRLALVADKRYWSNRSRIVCRFTGFIPKGNYGPRARSKGPMTMQEMAEDSTAWLSLPRPPPEIARWTPWEERALLEEVKRRTRLGEAVPWIEPDDSDAWDEYTEQSGTLLLAA